MKRKNNIHPGICSMENLQAADTIAQKGKQKQRGVKRHNKHREANLIALQQQLLGGTFRTSKYSPFTIYEPKERLIFRLPYYPDRIVQHGIMNQIETILVSTFTADTYSCIKGRGVHRAAYKVKRALKDRRGTEYCLKLDITKFYPSVNHGILKVLLRRKFKDTRLLHLLDGIIDSAPGLPIGNYLSQYLANFYLTFFDHWLKEEKKVRYYFRYADDIVILSNDKKYLHSLLADIRHYLHTNLKLEIKGNYQVFPVSARGIDFVGYKFFHTHTLLRKSIKKSLCREIAGRNRPQSVASLMGWAMHADTKHLLKKLYNRKGGTHEIVQTSLQPALDSDK